jgi:hypothetical protein
MWNRSSGHHLSHGYQQLIRKMFSLKRGTVSPRSVLLRRYVSQLSSDVTMTLVFLRPMRDSTTPVSSLPGTAPSVASDATVQGTMTFTSQWRSLNDFVVRITKDNVIDTQAPLALGSSRCFAVCAVHRTDPLSIKQSTKSLFWTFSPSTWTVAPRVLQ